MKICMDLVGDMKNRAAEKNNPLSPPVAYIMNAALVGFILMGRVFRKAFRMLGLGERKGRWAMEQDFHGDLQVNLAWFFAFFSGVLD